jgi:uncharacterized protein involved in outer membrane biogenesis
MRKLLIVGAVLVVLVLAGLLAVPYLIDVNQYHGRIQSELESHLGRSVSLGTLGLKLIPPTISVANLTVGEDKNFGDGAFAQAEQLQVSVDLWPLLRRDLQIRSLELVRPRIHLIHNSRDQWNFSTLGASAAPTSASSQAPALPGATPAQTVPSAPPQNTSPASQFSLASLQITDGQITVSEEQPRSLAVYDHIDAALKDFGPGKRFSLQAAAHLPGPGTETFKLEANVGPLSSAGLVESPIDGDVTLDGVSLGGLRAFLGGKALAGVDGIASGKIHVKNEGGKLAANGSLKLENGRAKNEFGYPIQADFQIDADLASKMIRIGQCSLKLGPTPFAVTGTVNAGATPPQLDLRVVTSDVSIAEAARLASGIGVAFGVGTTVSGQVAADVRAQGPANNLAMSGSLAVHNLEASGGELKQSVRVSSMELTLTPDAIRSNDFSATAGGTTAGVRFALLNYTTPSPSVDASLKAPNANIEELLSIAHAYGISAMQGITGNGALTLDVQASGPLKDPAAMNFGGSGQLQNASFKLPSLTKPLDVGHASLRFTQNSVVVENLAAALDRTSVTGTITVRNLASPDVTFTLAADQINVTALQQVLAGSAPPKKAGLQSWSLIPPAYAETPGAAQPGSLARVSGQGTLTVGTILYDQLTLKNVRSSVTLAKGVIRMSPVTADLYGGQQTGTIVVDTTSTPMDIQVSSSLKNVDANQLLSSVSSLRQTLFGLLATDANVAFRTASSQDIPRTLNGTFSLDLTKGHLANVDILNKLAAVGQFGAQAGNQKPFTQITRMTGKFDVKNGVAETSDLQAILDEGTLAAVGKINLVEQTLDMKATALLSKAYSQSVGGTQIGGFMNTALANNRGELVIPVLVTGSLQNPHFAPDVAKMAQLKLQNVLPSLSGLGQPGGLKGILGTLTGKGQGAPNGQQPQTGGQSPAAQPGTQNPTQPADVLEQLLNQAMIKKKKDQKPTPPQP